MGDEKKINWKHTLNLPQTGFPMKAQLNRKEPQILKKWQETDIYRRILEKRKDHPIYILHDGPPYANGHIHLGHALNKILKDFIVKTKSMEGFLSPYVPGWDCHGLPIEHKVDQQLGERKKEMTVAAIRRKCRDYAEKFLEIQRKEFIRLGVFGDWGNPYKTIDPSYEASVIEYFKSFVENKNVYRKKRPVFWCHSCQTALAEAEVEYGEHRSHSIYVKFLLADRPDFLKEFQEEDIFVLIWTTTPWTIPANLAIALHPDYDYALFKMEDELYVAAARLIPVIAELNQSGYKIVKEFKGSALEGFSARHPLYDRNSLIINTDYVVLDQGTGCVHTAPGHGEEDYQAGLEHGLDIYSPVGPTGLFDQTTGKYQGKQIFAANAEIIRDLQERGRLIYSDNITHSYPHCWRCKKPVIYRATEQWFVSMDTAELRKKALEAIRGVKWLPAWGEERIAGMLEKRPDWCISRQRDWGVPIPVFYCRECGQPLLDPEAVERVRDQFDAKGSDSWYEDDISGLIPPGLTCPHCHNKGFRKGTDILDVWFESGSSFGVLEKLPQHRFPAHMYIEGGDQYRGWFNSSLLVGISAKGISPYRNVITHGWALDEEGKAMSKSAGNVIEPQGIIDEKGAEILRLWIAMVNYREDIRLGREILSRVTESYRKIRNTWRFMLGVLSDFNFQENGVDDGDLREVDRFILDKLQKVKQKILQAYAHYDYHVIFHTISNFFTIDLSAFYLHFIKDNLYCNSTDRTPRRAAQTAIFKILKDTLLLMTPILSFTTEEAWEYLPHFPGKEESVHLHLFPGIEENYLNTIDEAAWNALLELREKILKEIEDARNDKTIGDSLEAEVYLKLKGDGNLYQTVSANLDMLREILVVAGVHLEKSTVEEISVRKSGGEKCPRCWNWFCEDTSENLHPALCPRCSRIVEEMNIDYPE